MRSTSQVVVPSILFVCLALTMSHAFTPMQMSYLPSSTSSLLASSKTLSSRIGNSVAVGSVHTRTINKAVATGCHDYGDTSTLRSRVGSALGDIKRRIVRQRPRVEVIEDVSDFDSILKGTKEQFVAVFFHSPVCKACQAAAPHFYKLAQKYSNVKFVSVPLTPGNKETLQQDLGVKKFPFGHIYHSQHGLLDELPILRKLVPNFEARLKSHVNAGSMGGLSIAEDDGTVSLDQETEEEACTE